MNSVSWNFLFLVFQNGNILQYFSNQYNKYEVLDTKPGIGTGYTVVKIHTLMKLIFWEGEGGR